MTTDTTFVSIPVEEYRDLVKAQKEAECLKAVLADKLKHYGSINYDMLEMLCTMFIGNTTEIEAKEEDF